MDVNTLRAMAKLMERESDEPDDLRGLRARAVTWAADEIERLRERLRGPDQSNLCVVLSEENDALIERLRAALESLTEDPEPTLDEPDADWEVIVKMRKIASDALNIHKHGS